MWWLVAAVAQAGPAEDLLRRENCVACHDLGSGAGVGPPLGGVLGRADRLQGGAIRVVDPGVLRRALTEPDAEVVDGYRAGLMPAVADPAKVDALVAAVTALSRDAGPLTPTLSPDAGERGPAKWLWVEVLGGLWFVGAHLGLSAARPLRQRLGGGFPGLYSAAVGVGFALLLYGWWNAPFVALWAPVPWTRWVPWVVMPFVAIFQVAGYSTRTPTMAGQAGALESGWTARGIHRITRHPVNISAAMWALAHLFPNGDVANVVLFGSVAALGILGSLHIDRRLAATHPGTWPTVAATTSVVPFGAILTRRNQLVLSEIGAARIVGGLIVFVAIVMLHRRIIGVSPLPW